MYKLIILNHSRIVFFKPSNNNDTIPCSGKKVGSLFFLSFRSFVFVRRTEIKQEYQRRVATFYLFL